MNKNYTLPLKTTIEKLILLAILLTPLYSYGDVLLYFTNFDINLGRTNTPIWIKLIKDVLMILIFFLSVVLLLKRKKIPNQFFIVFFILGVSVYSIIHSFYSTFGFLLGVRWLLPVALSFFLLGILDNIFLFKVAKILIWIFFVHFAVQVAQLFMSTNWYGINFLNLSLRNTGIFFVPNTSAFFSILVLYFMFYYTVHSKVKIITLILIPISIIFTASGTGVIVYITIYAIRLFKRFGVSNLLFVLLPILVAFSIPILDFVTGRVGVVQLSFGTRYEIFKDLMLNSRMFSEDFGFGTASAYLLSNYIDGRNIGIPTESLFSSIIVNLGTLPFLLFVSTLFTVLLKTFYMRSHDVFLFVVIYTMFGMTSPVLEVFPANLIMAVILSIYLPRIFNFSFNRN